MPSVRSRPDAPVSALTRMWAIVPLLLAGALGCGGRQESGEKSSQGAGEPPSPEASARPAEWAQPVEGPGLSNTFRVTEDLYRGAQPTAEGMRRLKGLGVRTVVNLRSFHSDHEETERAGLSYEHIYMKAWHPEEKEIVRFLRIVSDKNRAPVFVHCQHGSDRTGLMCAIYRVAICGWTREEALREMTQGGFGFHAVWDNLKTYFHDLDIAEMKRRAGIAS